MKTYRIIRTWATVLLLAYGLSVMFALGAFLAWYHTGKLTPFAVWSLWLIGFSLACYAAAKTKKRKA